MCSVSSVIDNKKNKNGTNILITAPMKAHQVHLVCLPIPRFLLICYQSNLSLHEEKKILGHVGKYTLFKEISKMH